MSWGSWGSGVNQDLAVFGVRLRACREAAGLSQEELALRSGLSLRTIGNLERASTRWPYRDTLQRLADGLDLRGQARAAFVAAAGRRRGRVESGAAGEAAGESAAASAPRQLPAAVPHFVGRAAELSLLTRLAGQQGARVGVPTGTAVVISVIAGTAGVGKTALALYCAHQVAALFPDGQLYVNLRGYDLGEPVDAADALSSLLLALGMDGRQIPAGLDDRAGVYRGLLAGRRMLVVLDNARDAQQVRPLLPGTGECLVLVTSRDDLAGLVARDGAIRVELDALPAADATALLRALIGPRVDNEPAAAAELIGLCCGLPLALRIAAELAAAHPETLLADLVAGLSSETRRLDLLAAGGDMASGIRPVFSWSLRHLDAEAAHAFTVLGLHPGPGIDACGLAALTGSPAAGAGQILEALARAHLIDPQQAGRFVMHDLLRSYARELAAGLPAQDQDAATVRLLDYYRHTAGRAEALISRIPRPAPEQPAPDAAPDITDEATAWAWLRTERPNLLALFHYASACHPAHAIALAGAMATLLTTDGPWAQAIAVQTTARDLAQHGTAASQARVHTDLAYARKLTGDLAAVDSDLTTALRLCGPDDRLEGANALTVLAQVRGFAGDHNAAGPALATAIDLYRELAEPRGQAQALTLLGQVHRANCDYLAAEYQFARALTLYLESSDQRGQADVLSRLAQIRVLTGEYPSAARDQQEALRLYRALGNRIGAATALNFLGLVHQVAGDLSAAAGALQQALMIFRDLGDPHGEAIALSAWGNNKRLAGDHDGAIADLEDALEIHRRIGARANQTWSLNLYACAIAASGNRARAIQIHNQARQLAQQTHQADEEANALEGIAECHLHDGNTGLGATHLKQALEIFQRLSMKPDIERVHARLDHLPRYGPVS